jgi:hypothetical protein
MAVMCATIRHLNPDKPEEIWVRIDIPRTTELAAIREALPDLKRELSERWPVASVGLSLRNPVNLSQWEVAVLIGLATPILKPLGEKLRDEAVKWLKSRFRAARKASPKSRVRKRH